MTKRGLFRLGKEEFASLNDTITILSLITREDESEDLD